jgi:hypothetical protein
LGYPSERKVDSGFSERSITRPFIPLEKGR